MAQDYYKILQVSQTADAAEIKRAYRQLSLRYHPDKNQGSKTAEDRFKEISEAYDVLGDEVKRQQYDLSRQLPDISKSASASGNVADGNIIVTVKMTLAEVALGAVKRIGYSRLVKCSSCNGTGLKEDQTCDNCNGSKVRSIFEVASPKLDPGAKAGNQNYFSLRGRGNYDVIRELYADLWIVVEYEPHPVFSIHPDREPQEQMNLRAEIDLKPIQYMLDMLDGGGIPLQTLYSKIIVRVQPEQISGGREVRIPKHGLPNFENTHRGDLYVRFNMKFPKLSDLTIREKKLLSLLAECKNFR